MYTSMKCAGHGQYVTSFLGVFTLRVGQQREHQPYKNRIRLSIGDRPPGLSIIQSINQSINHLFGSDCLQKTIDWLNKH